MSSPHTRDRRWPKLRAAILHRDGYRCVRCGSRERLEVDHIRAPRHGGHPWRWGNLQTLCRPCHIAKDLRRYKPRTRWRALVDDL